MLKYATYNGNIDPKGQMVGPTYVTGRYYTAVESVYDSETNTTRVGFAFSAEKAK